MPKNRKYVTQAHGMRVLEVTKDKLREFAAQGLIGVQRLPGMPPRYCLADIERLRDRCTVPVSDQAEAMGELVEA